MRNDMNKDKLKTRAINAFCASMLAVTLPTPPLGEFADTESSVNVPIEDVADRIRRLVLSFPANTSPTSCVQVAVGADLNRDECLEPEETQVIFGNDCGEWFVRNEAGIAGTVESVETKVEGEGERRNAHVFVFRRGKMDPVWNLAKVTMRGRGVEPPVVKAKFKTQGTVLFVR